MEQAEEVHPTRSRVYIPAFKSKGEGQPRSFVAYHTGPNGIPCINYLQQPVSTEAGFTNETLSSTDVRRHQSFMKYEDSTLPSDVSAVSVY